MPRILAPSLEAHGAIQREKILDATFALLQRGGYRAATLERIARDSGLARPSLYKYFSDRNHLLLEAVAHNMENALERARDQIAAIKEPAGRIGAWTTAIMTYVAGPEHDMLKLIEQIPLPQADVRARMASVHVKMLDQLRRDFTAALAGSGLDPGLWMTIFEVAARAAGRHVIEHGNFDAIHREVQNANRALFLTQFTSSGIRVLHP